MTHHIIQEADETPDGRRVAQAALRNSGPLIETLRTRLPAEGHVLEIASGTGQHVVSFAAAFPHIDWTPSDVDPIQRQSIKAWSGHSNLQNIAKPLAIDVAKPWPVQSETANVVLTINLLHLISEALLSPLFQNARSALCDDGMFIIYGPFLRGSDYASDGDRKFDASLQDRDPSIGYKSTDMICSIAADNGFALEATDHMPANNLLLTFRA